MADSTATTWWPARWAATIRRRPPAAAPDLPPTSRRTSTPGAADPAPGDRGAQRAHRRPPLSDVAPERSGSTASSRIEQAMSTTSAVTLSGGSIRTTQSSRPPSSTISPAAQAPRLHPLGQLAGRPAVDRVRQLDTPHQARGRGRPAPRGACRSTSSRRAICAARARTLPSTSSRSHDPHCLRAGGEGQLVAAEGAGVRARRPHVQPLVVEDDRHRLADPGQRLRRHDHVRLDAVLLEGEPRAGPPAAGLHLVDHQRDAQLAGQPPQPPHELGVGDNDAALALHHLDDHRGRAAKSRRSGRAASARGSSTQLVAQLSRVSPSGQSRTVGEREEMHARHPVGDRRLFARGR